MAKDLQYWLKSIGLGEYEDAFVENAVDFELLSHLSNEDLKELGISKLGDRKKLLLAIEQLEPKADVPTKDVASPDGSIEGHSEAERRQLSVMFCDLVGSTALSTRMDPEDYREVIRAYQDACAGVIARYDGYVAKFMGDGVLAYFGWPRGHEDDAVRAISAGLGILEAVGDIPRADGETEPLAVRIGIATGAVVVGDIVGEGAAQEAAVTGETPNLAARLQEIAEPNRVVIAATTHALAGGLFDYEALGGQSLKGIGGSTEVWQVLGERLVESRFAAAHTTALTPLIGREEELEILSRRWERAKGGNGQVVLLSGEPGIGKSRLTRATQDVIGEEPHTRLLFQCSSHYISSALYPTISQLEFSAKFDTSDDTNTKLDKLEALLQQSGQPTDEAMPLIAALLSIPANDRCSLPELTPQQQKTRTLSALIDQLVGLAIQQPVLFIFEDAHWIDPTSLELLELVIERIIDLPVLAVVTYRPEFSAPWIGRPHVALQSLNRLTSQECALMTERLVGERRLPPEILNQIADRTDGVPLFVEELTRSVVESDEGDGGDTANIVIPATLQDALEARFDSSPVVREVAQVGSSIGREFPYDLLSAVASLTRSELDAALDDLTASGLIFVRGVLPDANYTFKHALVQDTAYGSMVRSKRKDTHNRIVNALLSLRADIADTEPETLAHHYTEARQLEPAIELWLKAGQLAGSRSANPEAVALLERGLAVVAKLPPGEDRDRHELDVQTSLMGPVMMLSGQTSPELEAVLERTLDLSTQIGTADEWFRATSLKWVTHALGRRVKQSVDIARDFLERSKQEEFDDAVIVGQSLVGRSLTYHGCPVEALGHFDHALQVFKRDHHGHLMLQYGSDPEAMSMVHRANLLWLLGYPDGVKEATDLAISRGQELKHLNTLGPMLVFGFTNHVLLGDFAAAARVVDQLDHLLSRNKMPFFESMRPIFSSVWKMQSEPSSDVAAYFEDKLSQVRNDTNTATLMLPLYYSWLANAFLKIGEPQKAAEAATIGTELAETHEERWFEAEAHRLRGEAQAKMRDAIAQDEADSSLRKALNVAKSQQAKSLELRAATSLARLWQSQGKATEAHGLLRPIYEWFTEGFDTPDLIDAKALLDELS